ncbi:DUF4328 domain-containing protein [Nocardia goodfellowii]
MAVVVTARVIEWLLTVQSYRLRVDYENAELGAAAYTSRLERLQPWFGISPVAMLAQAAAGVLFAVWLYLARSNAAALSTTPHRLSRGWALACFLPVLNWFLPPIVLDDIQRARDVEEGVSADDEAIGAWVPVILLGLGVWAVAVMLAGGAFVYWLVRARANAEILAPTGQRLARGWVVGGWFVPLANLVVPALVVADIHRAGRPQARSAAWLIGSWWCVWIAAWVVAWIGLNFLEARLLWLTAVLFAVGTGLLAAIIWQTDSDQSLPATNSG